MFVIPLCFLFSLFPLPPLDWSLLEGKDGLFLCVKQGAQHRGLGSTYLSCQLGKQPPESIIDVVLADINLEGEAQKWDAVTSGRLLSLPGWPPPPPQLPSLPLSGLNFNWTLCEEKRNFIMLLEEGKESMSFCVWWGEIKQAKFSSFVVGISTDIIK